MRIYDNAISLLVLAILLLLSEENIVTALSMTKDLKYESNKIYSPKFPLIHKKHPNLMPLKLLSKFMLPGRRALCSKGSLCFIYLHIKCGKTLTCPSSAIFLIEMTTCFPRFYANSLWSLTKSKLVGPHRSDLIFICFNFPPLWWSRNFCGR